MLNKQNYKKPTKSFIVMQYEFKQTVAYNKTNNII